MSKLENNTLTDENSSHTGLVVFIIIAAIAGLIIFAVIVFLLISSSRRKHFQSRMTNARRSLAGSLRFRQSQNTAQVSPSTQQNIIIDSNYLSPTHLVGLSPPKYDSAPPSYEEVVNNQTDPTPPYTPRRGSAITIESTDALRNNNSSRNETLTIFPRRNLEEESQSRGNNNSAVIQVTEIVTKNKSKSSNKTIGENNSRSRNPQIFANNNTNIPRPSRLEESKPTKEEDIESSPETQTFENIQIT